MLRRVRIAFVGLGVLMLFICHLSLRCSIGLFFNLNVVITNMVLMGYLFGLRSG